MMKHVLKLLECGQLPLSLSHKIPNTVYINDSLENPTLKGFMSLQGCFKQIKNLLPVSNSSLVARTNKKGDLFFMQNDNFSLKPGKSFT